MVQYSSVYEFTVQRVHPVHSEYTVHSSTEYTHSIMVHREYTAECTTEYTAAYQYCTHNTQKAVKRVNTHRVHTVQ